MTITVTQLNNYIHGVIDMDGVLNNASVCGEVTNVKQSREGWYFSLKDEQSQIDCFCYGANVTPVGGSVVIAEGTINFWQKNGRLSFFVKKLTSTNNLGSAYEKFVLLRDKLSKEGLFDEERKKVVPSCCYTIGVVTSSTGAVIHDIENVALRRQPFTNILLYPVKVQGEGADVEIAEGVEFFSNSAVDVVIVARGGGSNEDLSVFNSEIVVRALSKCSKPTVSAIGHGVDYTLCDFVADKRAVTPSEAAELVTIDVNTTKNRIEYLLNNMCNRLNNAIEDNIARTSIASIKISNNVENKLRNVENKVTRYCERNYLRITELLNDNTNRLNKLTAKLSASNPLELLRKGYSYVTKDGTNVNSIADVSTNDVVNVKLSDGSFSATVKEVK